MDNLCNVQLLPLGAPDLILDLLGAERTAWPASHLCRAGTVMGINESAVRVALTRLVAEGKVERAGRGAYRLNRAGPALSRAVDAWREKEAQRVAWNGEWIAVHDAAVLRSDKTAWRHHQLALSLRGFMEFYPSLHIRPDNLAGGVAAETARLAELGLAPQALVFRLTDASAEVQAAARRLWDAGVYKAHYTALRDALRESRRRLADMALEDAVRETLLVGRTVIAQLVRDPLLPPELLSPRPRQTLLQETRAYQDKALGLWRKWLGTLPPGRAAVR
ncbi:PaaX family transcriptional regulator [Oxalobacteraceae bacterium OM1]|nr:PaaX family transcriptional regulator [Oxalobacteraceae bacterium OM1]